MTEEQRERTIRALLRERLGYERQGNTSGVRQVDEQLRSLGATAAPPVARAARRKAK